MRSIAFIAVSREAVGLMNRLASIAPCRTIEIGITKNSQFGGFLCLDAVKSISNSWYPRVKVTHVLCTPYNVLRRMQGCTIWNGKSLVVVNIENEIPISVLHVSCVSGQPALCDSPGSFDTFFFYCHLQELLYLAYLNPATRKILGRLTLRVIGFTHDL